MQIKGPGAVPSALQNDPIKSSKPLGVIAPSHPFIHSANIG